MGFILQLWHANFADLRLARVEAICTRKQLYELAVFVGEVSQHCDVAKATLRSAWFEAICNEIHTHRALVPRTRALGGSFFESAATLMAGQLRALLVHSLADYTGLLTAASRQFPTSAAVGLTPFAGFTVRMVLDDTAIAFEPALDGFEKGLLKIIDTLVKVCHTCVSVCVCYVCVFG